MFYVSQKHTFLHCSVPAEIPHKNSFVPAEIPPKNYSVPAEIPPKTLPSRPRYLLSFLLYCSFYDNTGGLKCIIMTKHIVLPNLSPPLFPKISRHYLQGNVQGYFFFKQHFSCLYTQWKKLLMKYFKPNRIQGSYKNCDLSHLRKSIKKMKKTNILI